MRRSPKQRAVTDLVCFSVLAACLSAISGCAETVPPFNPPREESWIRLGLDETKMIGPLRLYLKRDTENSASLYVKRNPKEPYHFLTKEIRSFAEIRRSNSHRFLLINAPCSPISRCVFVADIASYHSWIISRQAREDYRKSAHGPATRMYPLGVAFGPDETLVLLRMAPFAVPSVPENPDSPDSVESPPRLYVVEARDGTVIRSFDSDDVPETWAVRGPRPRDFIPGP